MLKIDKVQLEIIINSDPARKKMRDLEDEARKIRQEMKKMKEGSEEWTKSFEKLKSVETNMEKLRHEIGLNGLSVKELQKRYRELSLTMSHMDPRLPEWKALKKEQGEVKARLTELTTGAKQTNFSISKLADGFNKYFAVITAGIASIAGLIFSIRKTIDAFNEYEKTLDRLSALTGLVGTDLDWLSQEAKKMSIETLEGGVRITQSADAIVEAFTKVGSARPELLKDKQALKDVTQEAIILSEAAGSELQPAVEALTMVMNQYNVPASEARRIINTLAAGSKEGAGEIPYLTTAFEKAGTVAADAGISIEELTGAIETLAPRITQPEIAGRSLKGVLLDLQQGADDTNPAIVGLQTALENLGKKNLSVTELTRMFGTENITTAKILINNVGELKKYTEAVTDTNVAIEQASINTDNNASRLEQARNKVKLMTIELGEKMAPALTISTSGFTYFLKAVSGFISFFSEYKTFIVSATMGLIAYGIAVNASNIAFKLHYYWLSMVEKAQKLWNLAQKQNILGLMVAAVVAAGTAIAMLSGRLTSAERAQRAVNDVMNDAKKKIVDQKVEMELLLKTARDETKSKEERLKAIKALNELSPEYLGKLSLETINTNAARVATDEYTESLLKLAKVEAAKTKLKELAEQRVDLETGTTETKASTWQVIKNAWSTEDAIELKNKNLQTEIENRNQLLAEITAQENALMQIINEASSVETVKEGPKEGDLKTEEGTTFEFKNGKWVALSPQTNGVKDKDSKDKRSWQSDILTDTPNWVELDKQREDEFRAAQEKLLKLMDDYFEQEQLKLSEQFAMGELTQQEYDAKKEDMLIMHLSAVKTAKEQMGMETLDMEKQLSELSVKNKQAELAQKEKESKEAAEKERKRIEEMMDIANQFSSNMGRLIGETMAGIEGQEKEFSKRMIQIALDTLERIVMIEMAKITAKQIGSKGFAGIPAAAALNFLVISAFETAKALVAKQFYEGNFQEVIGASDGRRYHAKTGSGTGLYGQPSLIPGLGLVAERSPEIVFSGPDTRRILNTPGLVNAINATLGVRQFAAGNAREIIRESSTIEKSFTDPALLLAIERLNLNIERGIQAKVITNQDYIETHNKAISNYNDFQNKINGR